LPALLPGASPNSRRRDSWRDQDRAVVEPDAVARGEAKWGSGLRRPVAVSRVRRVGFWASEALYLGGG